MRLRFFVLLGRFSARSGVSRLIKSHREDPSSSLIATARATTTILYLKVQLLFWFSPHAARESFLYLWHSDTHATKMTNEFVISIGDLSSWNVYV